MLREAKLRHSLCDRERADKFHDAIEEEKEDGEDLPRGAKGFLEPFESPRSSLLKLLRGLSSLSAGLPVYGRRFGVNDF